LGSHKKNKKIQKNVSKNIRKKSKKIIGAIKRCWNDEKRPKFVEEVQKCKMLKFDNISLTDESPVNKENSILKKIYSKSDVYRLN
jgi:hypothetical protein